MKIVSALSIAFVLLAASSPTLAQNRDTNRIQCLGPTGRGGDLPRLISDCSRLINAGEQTSAGHAILYYRRASLYIAANDLNAALADLNEAIRIDQTFAAPFRARAGIFFAQGQHQRAIDDYGAAIALAPTNAEAYVNRGAAYSALADNTRALADFDQAISLDAENDTAYFNRANAYAALGDHPRAIADYDQVIALRPRFAPAFNNRGSSYFATGDRLSAISDFNVSLQLNPEHAGALENLANACGGASDDARVFAACEATDEDRARIEAEAEILAAQRAQSDGDAGARAASAARENRDVSERRFRDVLANGAVCSFCPELIAVPAGAFRMGSSRREPGHGPDEGPVRLVRVSSFAIGRFEVTRAQYLACVDSGACTASPDIDGARYPISNVSWTDAQDYVRWLSRVTARRYRLLSEAEWEYAARARSRSVWSWGPDSALGCTYANVWDQSVDPNARHACSDGFPGTVAPVGSLTANAFGIHDMQGNVWEWVQDCYVPAYPQVMRAAQRMQNRDGSVDADPVELAVCENRVDRGGAWDADPADVRSAQRSRHTPGLRAAILGIRIARDF